MTQPLYEWTKDEAQIIKAAWASDHGKMALTLIVERLAGIHAGSFSSDALLMAFNEGRRFVGRELMTAINRPIDKLVKAPDEPRSNRPLTATERAAASERDANRSAIRRPTGSR